MVAAILILMGLLAAVAKAVADAQAHGSPRLARWFGQQAGPDSWRLKYKNGDPAQGPRFFLSTTALAWVTDLWHFANAIMWLIADSMVVVLGWKAGYAWAAVGYVVARRVVFEPIYRLLRK